MEKVTPLLNLPQTCPCCGQRVQLYRRKLYREPAQRLIRLVQLHLAGQGDEAGFVHIGCLAPMRALTGGGDFAKLRLWSPPLIEEKPNGETAKRTSGLWRPTEAGIAFVRGELLVATSIDLFNQTFYGASINLCSISDALGEPFNYADLMAAAE